MTLIIYWQLEKEIYDWLKENGKNLNVDLNEKRFQTFGRNSSETPFKWRDKLTFRKTAAILMIII